MNRALDHAAVERRALRAAGDCLAEGILTHVSGYFQSRRGTRVSAYNRGPPQGARHVRVQGRPEGDEHARPEPLRAAR
jgi:hypothetical protein